MHRVLYLQEQAGIFVYSLNKKQNVQSITLATQPSDLSSPTISLLSCTWIFSNDDYNCFAIATSLSEILLFKSSDQNSTLASTKPLRKLSLAQYLPSSPLSLLSVDLSYAERSTP